MPTITQLKEAITIAEQIQSLEAELSIIIVGGSLIAYATASTSSAPSRRGGKRTMSPEARARIAAAQKARWAKSKGTSTPAATPQKTAGKRVVSAESRAKMAAAQHARWARNNPSAPAKAPKKKGALSPEGRARIVAALKARHAARRMAAKLQG